MLKAVYKTTILIFVVFICLPSVGQSVKLTEAEWHGQQ